MTDTIDQVSPTSEFTGQGYSGLLNSDMEAPRFGKYIVSMLKLEPIFPAEIWVIQVTTDL